MSESVIYNGNGEVFSVVTADKIVRNYNLIQAIAGPTQAPFQVNPLLSTARELSCAPDHLKHQIGLYDNMWDSHSKFGSLVSRLR